MSDENVKYQCFGPIEARIGSGSVCLKSTEGGLRVNGEDWASFTVRKSALAQSLRALADHLDTFLPVTIEDARHLLRNFPVAVTSVVCRPSGKDYFDVCHQGDLWSFEFVPSSGKVRQFHLAGGGPSDLKDMREAAELLVAAYNDEEGK